MNPGFRLSMLAVMVCVLAACSHSSAPPGTRTGTPLDVADQPVDGRRLSLVSWNLAWLADLRAGDYWAECAAKNGSTSSPMSRLPPCDAYARQGIFDAAGFEAKKLAPLRQAFADQAARSADVIAVQEVQGASALQSVLPPGYRIACVTTQDEALNLGFVVREGADLEVECRELASLSLEDDPSVGRPLRRGLELDLRLGGIDIVILNVHLKAGCSKGRMDDPSRAACRLLQRQVAPLEEWMEAQARARRNFIVIGDWNRDLEAELRGDFPARADGSDPAGPLLSANVRNLFREIVDHQPSASDASLAVTDRSAAVDGACFEALDQLLVSNQLLSGLEPALLSEGRLSARLILGPQGASDHCALESALVFRQRDPP